MGDWAVGASGKARCKGPYHILHFDRVTASVKHNMLIQL